MNLIRKIVIGQNPKDAMAYYIGMRVGQMKVDSNVLDEKHLVKYSIKRYSIFERGGRFNAVENSRERTLLN